MSRPIHRTQISTLRCPCSHVDAEKLISSTSAAEHLTFENVGMYVTTQPQSSRRQIDRSILILALFAPHPAIGSPPVVAATTTDRSSCSNAALSKPQIVIVVRVTPSLRKHIEERSMSHPPPRPHGRTERTTTRRDRRVGAFRAGESISREAETCTDVSGDVVDVRVRLLRLRLSTARTVKD